MRAVQLEHQEPWWKNLKGPFPEEYTSEGVKSDYGGCMCGKGIVGPRLLHQAAHKGKAAEVERLVKEDEHNVNEVDATGSTPLHAAAFEGTETVAETLIRLGAAVDASANDGSRAIHRAQTMRNDNIVQLLKNADASTSYGRVIVPEHLDKVHNFYEKDPEHPLPSLRFIEQAKEEEERRKELSEQTVPAPVY